MNQKDKLLPDPVPFRITRFKCPKRGHYLMGSHCFDCDCGRKEAAAEAGKRGEELSETWGELLQ